ncbi:acyltransferase family protein [Sanguibacter suaedae]|uniref:Acyltransferase n=1 Tax=Sanguibacter suaedae TaxID=2795737 RepID=A0A934I522_9MICO|nr:acyltransferase family protein [Sanguibacter suaedae]MBI9114376.1 acyltransferase [Sanguibacter suaedae]
MVTAPTTPPPRPAAAGRARIHGLDSVRALAVLAVVAFHLAPTALPGGFLGVDVFFVLSGFLITTLLVRERERTGRVSLTAFWARRVRRLLPALLVVVVTCTSVAGVLGGDVLVGIRAQVLGALTFSSNWVYVAQGASYTADLSPQLFANLWSLAVEEQFYLVWPLVVVAVLAVRRSRATGLVTTGVVAAGSAVWMAVLHDPTSDTSRAYYGTDTHLFGLMLGAFLALWLAPRAGGHAGAAEPLVTLRPTRATALRLALGTASLAGLGALALELHVEDRATYEGGLLLASVLTVGLLLAIVGTQGVAHRLEVAPLRWIGERSYGIYLWHWPVAVLVAEILDAPSAGRGFTPSVAVTVLVLTTVASWASYRFVERPVLDRGVRTVARAVAARATALLRLARSGDGRRRRGARAALVSVVALAVALVAASVAAVVRAPETSELEAEIQRGAALLEEAASAEATDDASPSSTSQPTQEEPEPGTTAPTAPEEPAPAEEPADPTEPSEPPVLAAPPGDQVTIIGDSVTLTSVEAVQAALPGVAIDAAVSRQMRSTAEAVAALGGVDALRPYVVLSLATNSTVDERVVEEALAAVGPDRTVVLVTGHGDRPWIGPTNDQLRAAAARHPDVVVADWQAAIAPHPDGVAKDGVHPAGGGRDIYAAVLRDALAQARAAREGHSS